MSKMFEGFDYLKYVASGAETVADVVSMLEVQIAALNEMEKDGVEIDLQNIEDGHLRYTTEDPKIAIPSVANFLKRLQPPQMRSKQLTLD